MLWQRIQAASVTSGGHRMLLAFAVGLLIGAVLFRVALLMTGAVIVSEKSLSEQQEMLAALEEDNRLLSDDLFGPQNETERMAADGDYPYDARIDAREAIATARATAIAENKYLMITFGANWCVDCRTLYKTLNSDIVSDYARDRFVFANVNVGEFNRNLDVAAELGVSLARGIPVAIFFDASGAVIGATNSGELEPARHFTSNQILKFVRDVAERSQIRSPNSVRQ